MYIVVMVLLCLIVVEYDGFTKQNDDKTKQPLPGSKKQLSISEKVPVDDTSTRTSFKNIMVLIGGGYFVPNGTEGKMLNPGIGGTIMVQSNNIQKTLFGIGTDISYAKLDDKEYNGSIMYITMLPNVTATFPLYKSIYLQGKAGPGVSDINSKINNKTENTLSATIGGGAGLFVAIQKRFIIGCEAKYYYYFQIHSSSSYFFTGFIGYVF